MNAAHQIQAQHHRLAAEVGQPIRHGRSQVQGNRVVLTGRIAQHRGGLGLRIKRRQTDDQVVVALLFHRLGRDACFGQCSGDALLECVIDLPATTGGDLYGRILLIDVRQRIQRADRQNDQDQKVLPAWKFEHCGFLRDAFPGVTT
ncbi:hypothetical protein D3C81_1798290 [compost metagenome]